MKGKITNLKIHKTAGKNKSSKGIWCYEYQGFGDIASDYGNRKSKKKALNTTWGNDTSNEDDENHESNKSDTSKGKFIAFMEPTGSATSHVSFDDKTDHDDNE